MPHITQRAPRLVAAAASLLAFASAIVHAQDLPAGAPPTQQQAAARAAEGRKAFYKQLELTPPQIARIETLQKKYGGLMQTKMKEMQKKYGANPNPEQRNQAMQELTPFLQKTQAASEKDLLKILTPAQQKKFKALKTKAMQGGAPPR